MNPSNPFGSPQGGAFQAPSNTMKTGMFQPFGQQSSGNQPQNMGFYQPSAFGQPSAQGGTIFGQTPAFGQSSAQPPSLPAASQAPAFGQQSLAMGTTGFGSTTASAFGQTSAPSQSSVFGQTPAFGQPSAFGQAPGFSQQPQGFGKQPPAYGQQPSGFGNSQMSSASTAALGPPQPLGFGQSVFGQPTSTSTTTSVFGTGQNVTQQSRGFGSTKFSFKPANEALFKPIFSASPEPANPQTTSMSSSPFGSSGSQTSASTMNSGTATTTGFSRQLGFSFSQPAAAPSISAQNNPLTTGSSSRPSNTQLQFTFSQPAAPSSSNAQASTTQPTTPSSFSFSAKGTQPQATPLFGGTNFGQPSAFGDVKPKTEISTDDKGSNLEGLGETNVFARLGKGTKRKDDPVVPTTGPEKAATEEEVPADAESPRHPPKRPLMRSRAPLGGLFGRALSDLRRDGTNPARREATRETQPQAATWEETEREEVQAKSDDRPATPPTAQTLTKDMPEKAEESGESYKSHSLCIMWTFHKGLYEFLKLILTMKSNCMIKLMI